MINHQIDIMGLKITKKSINNMIINGNSFIILKYFEDLRFILFLKFSKLKLNFMCHKVIRKTKNIFVIIQKCIPKT